MKIAVVGSGIAGIVSAYLLSKKHEVHLFERNDYLGGHTNTRFISEGPDAGTAVDTGFIVCNQVNYPNFYRFLAQLGVKLQASEMSFGYQDAASNFSYLGPTPREFLKVPLNLFRPSFLRFIVEQSRFNRTLLSELNSGKVPAHISLGAYVREKKVSPLLVTHYIAPLVASIWSSPDRALDEFPLLTFATFFKNHGMLEFGKIPRWETLVGGSIAYVNAFKRAFSGRIFLNSPAQKIKRTAEGVTLQVNNETLQYDKIVIAAHADQALSLLSDPAPEEQSALGTWKYNRNHTVLHTDAQVLGPHKKLWASWNYRRMQDSAERLSITYYMNRLQKLRTANNYFVTLNPSARPEPQKRIYEITYEHPVYSERSVASQTAIKAINGARHTYFCGAYLGYGFHEDGVNSGLQVADHFGLAL